MRSAILMGSVAAAALATPALALPDRYEQGYSCTGQGALCMQEQFREDGNRFNEKGASVGGGLNRSSSDETQAAARTSDDDDNLGDELEASAENTADEAGDEIDEAGDEIENAADEAGDEIEDALD